MQVGVASASRYRDNCVIAVRLSVNHLVRCYELSLGLLALLAASEFRNLSSSVLAGIRVYEAGMLLSVRYLFPAP